MESGDVGASLQGVLAPVSDSSDVFQNSILAPLRSAYLYEESKQSFRYTSAVLVKNARLEQKYEAFRANRRQAGYSEEVMEETYGFLLFDDINKAHALGETGVLTGNGTCTTLGDPGKGVYISMYSDCLDLNRWYHGKSGYIAIIRLTKGRVKQVLENYTQNFTSPTVGFDCHVSEELPSVSAETSCFLAFERTQYYMYELLDGGSTETDQSPSAACPFAIVSFSYTDTKATLVQPQETSEEKKLVCHYLAWTGQLQIGTKFYDVGLRSTAGALIPTKLPPVVKVDRAISMPDLIQLLPRAAFETCFSGEVDLGGLYCSLCELVPSVAEEANLLSLLLQEIKEKDLALPVPLNDGGFLILLHSSHLLTYDDNGSNATEVLQGMFIFPGSRVIERGTKSGQRKATISSEILRVLPVLSYAEGEVEKTPFNSTEELCEVLAQHMQTYAALINPRLDFSPSREVIIFPDQYDVRDDHKHLYSSPEWTNKSIQSFRSYMSKPVSFQLPVSKASGILAAGQEEQREDLDDDVYICLSSPEQAPASPVGMGSEDQLTDQNSCITSTEAQVCLITVPHNVVPDDLQAGDATKVNEKSDLTVLIKTDEAGAKKSLTPPTSDDLSAELIVSITSAEQTVTNERLNAISTVPATKYDDFQIPGFSAPKLQTEGVSTLHDETVEIKKDCQEVTNFIDTKQKEVRRGHSKCLKKASESCVEILSLQTVKIPGGNNISISQKANQAKESSGHSQLNNTDWRKSRRRKRIFGKLSPRNKKLRRAPVGLTVAEEQKTDPGQQSLEDTILMELEICPLKKKTERWDLRPVISECGRILVPHGYVDMADQIQSLKHKLQCTKDERYLEKVLADTPVNAHDNVEMEQESTTAPETAVDETEVNTSKDGGNHLQNVVNSHLDNEHGLLRQSDNGLLSVNPESSEQSSKNGCIDTPPSEEVKETKSFFPGKCTTKGEFLLSKLKSVLLKAKRKHNSLGSEVTKTDTDQNTEPCLKKGKDDSDVDALKSNAITSVHDTNVGVKDVTKLLSVDPLFAYALGLTPKEKPETVQKTEGQDAQLSKDSPETLDQAISNKQHKIIHRPPPIFPRRGRIKTLKKHQGVSEENVKRKWWLHFQTPACFPAEKLKNKSCTRDNSVRTTVKEKKMNNCCSSTDALNLLADLALSASNDQVPPQPALEGKPETSLKKLGLTKDETNAEQESLLHALLRQPAARPFQPLESPSPSPPVGDTELVSLISKEHAYSLHPSSPLLLGLPGSPFQASPLSGSTKMLHHQQQLYGDGIQTAQPTVRQKDRGERNHKTQEYLKKHVVCRRKFRYSRTFVDKDGSVQVTKQWDENYDFNRDSKFASDSKSKAVMRALHGPWDFSIHDNTEEVRLIVHMWIGLFYSRSTARYFHVDSNFTNLCLEDSDSLEMSSGMESAPAKSEQKANSFGAFPSITDTEDHSDSKALDLSKNDDSVLDQGSLILDLSLRNSSAATVLSDRQINREDSSFSSERKKASEILNTLKSLVGLQEASTLQCCKTTVPATEIINEVNDISSHNESAKTCSPSQKAGCLEHIDIPSFIGNGSFSPPQVETESRSLWTENVQTTSGIGHMSHGCNNEEAHMKNDIENSQSSEMSLVQKYATDLSKSMTDKDVESNKEADEVAHADENDEIQSQDGKNWEVKENPREVDNIQPSPEVIHTGDGSLYKESDIVCNGNCFGNEKLSSREETIAVSSGQAENVNEDVDFCTVHNDKMTENPLGKDDRLDENDSGVSAVETDSDMSNQPLHMMCDGPDSVQDCFTDCSRHAPFLEQPPQAFQDSKLEKLCADGSALTDELAISEKAPHMPYEMEPVHNVPAVEENSENYSCLADEAHYQKATLPISDEGICSLDGSCVARFIPPTKDSLETGNSDDHEDQETNLNVTERKDGNSSQEESFHHQSHSPQCEARKRCEEEAVTGETDLKMNKSTEGRETSHSGLIIPSIAIDIVQLHISHSQDKVEEVVQDQKGIQFISETACSDLPEDVCSTSETYSRKEELHGLKISPLDVGETNQPVIFGSESDDRSRTQTPTLDEKPFDCIPCSGPGISTEKTCINTTPRCLSKSSTPISDKMPLEQKLCHKSRVNSDPISHDGQHHDLEQRTLRVLQSIDKFLSKSNQLTNDMKNCLDQKPNLFRKYTPPCLVPSHTSPLAVVSASTSQELPKESSDDFLVSPYKSQLEEVLGVKLQVKKTDSPLPKHSFERPDAFQETSIGQVYCHSYRSSPSTECFQTIETDVDQGGDMPQSNLNNRPHSYSQSPVMAVNPSKSDESQSDCIPKDGLIERSPKNKLTKTPTVNYTTPTPMPLEKKTDIFEENSGLNGDKQECSEFSSKSNLLSNVNDSNLDEATLSSSLSMHSFELEKSGGHQGFLTHSLLEKVGQTTKENNEMDQKDCSEAPASYVDDKDNNMIDDSLILGPQTSLTCTVFNTSQKRSHSFLEQVSQRCLQDDPTQASMEQECLIFSEQMKQLSKKSKSKRGPSQQDKHDKLTSSCASPVTVHFSSLEEQEDSLDLLDASSLARQKIKVDMSDRKDRADSKEEEGTLHPEKLSQGTGNLKEPAVVSCVTAKCAELYEAMMDDVCAVGKVPPKPKHLGVNRGSKNREPSHLFDFCDQMKREMDESFRSNLNSFVKKSCKTKYRFYMLVTSDDALFDETKAQLEAVGHTAVQPSEFFLGEGSSSSLLIILRNEDIAEHICEVPHLLELKKAPGVLFAGIDEPDDVVNLTHQELFTRGGFIMFDRAALEPLSLCNMEKCSEILRVLSRTGKWKWLLHYRDSRRLKENARLSAEDKEKKCFLNSCEDTGFLEVLPYHECDLMSRDQPDYLSCLVRLQVQNISARYPIFITDTTTDSAFGRNGILTMTVNSFLEKTPSETFYS
ncbi:uncharacterized protein tasor2 isoform X2 [Scophthalmus maximus]|uniref:uncharacterized protein tasor2 isoform X2 n=1 Tax=Scophthalmus maximus TaxID=52904 RepID=UPI001FA90A05|nr:uncharacterized protein tasor2 isoform X2 [Scophthalmus maximus]